MQMNREQCKNKQRQKMWSRGGAESVCDRGVVGSPRFSIHISQ